MTNSHEFGIELSSKVEYALLALIELASHPRKRSPLRISEITANQAIPNRYLEQILNSLRRSGIVQSQRGAKGGYVLTREPWQITVLDVITSVEGEGSGRKGDRTQSPTLEKELVYEIWQQANTAAQEVLGRYTLQDLCQRRELCKQNHPMYYI
jgi:Rrf2 family protein